MLHHPNKTNSGLDLYNKILMCNLICVMQAILNGRDSVRKVLETFKTKGGSYAELACMYYGQVIENFQCDKNIQTAVEVTSGGRLVRIHNSGPYLNLCISYTMF